MIMQRLHQIVNYIALNEKALNNSTYKDFLLELFNLIEEYKIKFIAKEELNIICLGFAKCNLYLTENENDSSEMLVTFGIERSEIHDRMPILEEIPGCCCEDGNDICKKADLKELFKCRNFRKFVELNPNIKNLFRKEKVFELLYLPVHRIKITVEIFEKNVKNLFNLIQLQHFLHENKRVTENNFYHRIILLITLFDFLMSNYFYACLYKNFYVNAFYELNRIHEFYIGEWHRNKIKKYKELNFLMEHNIEPQYWFDWFRKVCVEL